MVSLGALRRPQLAEPLQCLDSVSNALRDIFGQRVKSVCNYVYCIVSLSLRVHQGAGFGQQASLKWALSALCASPCPLLILEGSLGHMIFGATV